MKKRIAAGLLAGALALGSLPALAAEQVTYLQLKEAMPERLTLSRTVKGKTVTIDAEILLPETEALPILQAERAAINEVALQEKYGKYEDLLAGTGRDKQPSQQSPFGVFLSPYRNESGKSAMVEGVSQFEIPKKYGSMADIVWQVMPDADQPENNPLPPNAPAEKMREALEVAGVGDLELRVTGQVVTRRPFKAKETHYVDPEHKDWGYIFEWIPDEKNGAIPEREIGKYKTAFSLYLRDARVAEEFYRVKPVSKWPEENGRAWTHYMTWFEMFTEEDFSLHSDALFREQWVIEQEQLAPFEVIEKTIAKRIDAGLLRDVYQMELCYMPCLPPDVNVREMEKVPVQSVIMAPVWVLYCDDKKNDYDMAQWRSYGDKAFALSMAMEHGASYQLRIDAITGEAMTDYRWWTYPPDMTAASK